MKSTAAIAFACLAGVEARRERWYATCKLEANPALEDPSFVSGLIKLKQYEGGLLRIASIIGGLCPDGESSCDSQNHGFHVHSAEYDGENCGSSGGHFNPTGVEHAVWYNTKDKRHTGDLKMLSAR